MIVEIITTPSATLVWAPAAHRAVELRLSLTDAGHSALEVDADGLVFALRIADVDAASDAERILNVGFGQAAHGALTTLVDAGHDLTWHRLQRKTAKKAWGVPVRVWHAAQPRTLGSAAPIDRESWPRSQRPSIESAIHFELKVRGSRQLGLRMSRETYARINKRSSFYWHREDDPALWDRISYRFEDDDHRFYTDEWCTQLQERALANFDLNIAHFASLDRDEFEIALQTAVSSQRGMTEVTDLTEWNGKPGLYIMVLDDYAQVYVGATNHVGGVTTRIRQHWTGTHQLDRLIWPAPESSIMAIDSFRALDTTRIFAVNTSRSFDGENPLLNRIPPKFALNRIIGGRDPARFAGILGIKAIVKSREFILPTPTATPPAPEPELLE